MCSRHCIAILSFDIYLFFKNNKSEYLKHAALYNMLLFEKLFVSLSTTLFHFIAEIPFNTCYNKHQTNSSIADI